MVTAIVVYDPWYGCTQTVAEEVARGLSADGRVATIVANVRSVTPQQLLAHEVIVIGTPSRRGAPTPRIRRLLEELRSNELRTRQFVFFETCFAPDRGKAIGKMESMVRDSNPFLSMLFLGLSVVVRSPRGPILPGELSKCRELGRSVRACAEVCA
jgi:flavorubredoxin